MKHIFKYTFYLLFLSILSCNDPETVQTLKKVEDTSPFHLVDESNIPVEISASALIQEYSNLPEMPKYYDQVLYGADWLGADWNGDSRADSLILELWASGPYYDEFDQVPDEDFFLMDSTPGYEYLGGAELSIGYKELFGSLNPYLGNFIHMKYIFRDRAGNGHLAGELSIQIMKWSNALADAQQAFTGRFSSGTVDSVEFITIDTVMSASGQANLMLLDNPAKEVLYGYWTWCLENPAPASIKIKSMNTEVVFNYATAAEGTCSGINNYPSWISEILIQCPGVYNLNLHFKGARMKLK